MSKNRPFSRNLSLFNALRQIIIKFRQTRQLSMLTACFQVKNQHYPPPCLFSSSVYEICRNLAENFIKLMYIYLFTRRVTFYIINETRIYPYLLLSLPTLCRICADDRNVNKGIGVFATLPLSYVTHCDVKRRCTRAEATSRRVQKHRSGNSSTKGGENFEKTYPVPHFVSGDALQPHHAHRLGR